MLDSAVSLFKELVEAGGGRLSTEDDLTLRTEADQITDTKRSAKLFIDAQRGFFVLAARSRTFVDPDTVRLKLGDSIESNYAGGSPDFLKLATTYWTLRLRVDDFLDEHGDKAVVQLLKKLETDIASVFFPTPGPISMPVALRKKMQRDFLATWGAPLDANAVVEGSPITRALSGAGAGKSGGCALTVAVAALAAIVLVLAMG